MKTRDIILKVLTDVLGEDGARRVIRSNEIKSPFADMLNLEAPENYEETFRACVYATFVSSPDELRAMENHVEEYNRKFVMHN